MDVVTKETGLAARESAELRAQLEAAKARVDELAETVARVRIAFRDHEETRAQLEAARAEGARLADVVARLKQNLREVEPVKPAADGETVARLKAALRDSQAEAAQLRAQLEASKAEEARLGKVVADVRKDLAELRAKAPRSGRIGGR